jgi:hypothetical protein
MVDTMNRGEPSDCFASGTASGAELPTAAAVLSILFVSYPGGPAESPVSAAASIPAGWPARRFPGLQAKRVTGNQDRVVLAMRRIQAAIEAETAAVPDRSAQTIEAELARIMSSRTRPDAPGPRRWSRPVPHDDSELTPAAQLQIRLVHTS